MLSNKLGNTEGGMPEFRAALQADPNHVEARKAIAAFYINRGANARQQQRLPDAIQDLQEAVKFDPTSSTPHLELGIAYQESGRLSEAVQEYQAAVTADPKNLTAQIRLGQGYNAQKQYDQATTAFKAVLEGNPNSAEAYAGLGAAHAHQGQAEEAKKAFAMAIRKHLVAGRRDLAMKVKRESDTLLPPTSAPPQAEKGKR